MTVEIVQHVLSIAASLAIILGVVIGLLQLRYQHSLRQAESRGLPIHILKSNTVSQVRDALSRIYGVEKQDEATTLAMAEAAAAIRQVKSTLRPVEISPQNAYLRRLQHQLVAENDLSARSTGKEPQRRLRITPSPEEPTL